jgi:hypothetical protein
LRYKTRIMDKLVYTWRPDVAAHLPTFGRRVTREIAPGLLREGPAGLVVHVTDERPPRLAVVPFLGEPIALISIHDERDGAAEFWTGRLSALGGRLAGYRVTEAVPVAHDRTWPDGTRTPGAGLLTLLRGNPRLTHDDFIHEWHGKHTPMSLEIHPLWHYVRNVVEERITDRGPAWDGIVTEHFRTRSDLTSPVRLFGGALRFVPAMVRVGLHVNHFLDMATLETYLVSEYCFREPG